MRRLALITALIVSSCSVFHVKQAWSETIVYLDITFDFEEEDPESADFKALLEARTTPRALVGVNQAIRGNAPGVVKASLRDGVNVIEILWPGFDDVPLYSLVINPNTLTQQSVEVIVSDLYFATHADGKMGFDGPVIVIEPNKTLEASITEFSDSFYRISLPPNAVTAMLSYMDYEHELSGTAELRTVNYGQRTFADWNDFPHVTMGSDQSFVSYAYRDPSEGSFEPLWASDFATKALVRGPTKVHESELTWTLKTEPPDADILLTGILSTKRTLATMDLTDSQARTIVFQMENRVQCPYDDATREFPSPGKAVMSCDLEPEPPRNEKTASP